MKDTIIYIAAGYLALSLIATVLGVMYWVRQKKLQLAGNNDISESYKQASKTLQERKTLDKNEKQDLEIYNDLIILTEQHSRINNNIDGSRQMLIGLVYAASLVVAIFILARLILGLYAYSNNNRLADLASDHWFWMSTFGVGFFVQILAAILLHSQQSFYKQSINSFEYLSRIHLSNIAIKLLQEVSISDENKKQEALLEVIKNISIFKQIDQTKQVEDLKIEGAQKIDQDLIKNLTELIKTVKDLK